MSRGCGCFKIEGYNILWKVLNIHTPREWQPDDLATIFHSPYRSKDIVAKHIYQIVHAWNSKRPVSNGWKWLDHHFPCKYLESSNRNKHFGMNVSCKSIFWTSYVLHRTNGWNPNWWRFCSNISFLFISQWCSGFSHYFGLVSRKWMTPRNHLYKLIFQPPFLAIFRFQPLSRKSFSDSGSVSPKTHHFFEGKTAPVAGLPGLWGRTLPQLRVSIFFQ